MKTLAFCTSWADNDDTWRYRYRKWFAHMQASPLHASQLLVIDDGSPGPLVLPHSATLSADALPGDCPESPGVVIRFAERLGRKAVLDYPGWWRSFTYAADYAERYGFDKVVHVESDSYILSPRLCEYINELERGWVGFWCPRSSFPETCIQVICPDQLHAYFDIAAQPYEVFVGKAAEMILPFTHVESNFKGDRYGEYRTELPLDADYAVQVPWSTDVWCKSPPPPRRVLALTVGYAAIPPHPTLYPRDAWEVVASSSCTEIGELSQRLEAHSAGSLDAVQLTFPAMAVSDPLPLDAMRRALRVNGELALNLRPNGNSDASGALERSLLEGGFAGMGVQQVKLGGDWILALSADNTLGPVLCKDRLTWRLQYLARCHGYELR